MVHFNFDSLCSDSVSSKSIKRNAQNHPPCYPFKTQVLNNTGILQQVGELALLCLEVRVATNVLLLNVDVGNGALTIDLPQRSLNIGSISCDLTR